MFFTQTLDKSNVKLFYNVSHPFEKVLSTSSPKNYVYILQSDFAKCILEGDSIVALVIYSVFLV